MKKTVCIGIVLLFLSLTGYAQKSAQIKALNNYVNFTNESIHGLLIVHRLLENFNQDINKYVDLDGFQLNFYTNKDLPKNIFEDPEDWFYKESPLELFAVLEADDKAGILPQSSQLLSKAFKMKNICNAINKVRFEVEDYISSHDLTNPKQLQGVYDLLENGVTYYSDFYKTQVELETAIENAYQSTQPSSNNAFYQNATTFNQSIKSILRNLRNKKNSGNVELLKQIVEPKNYLFSNINQVKEARYQKRVKEKITDILQAIEDFLYTADVPEEYKLYKKFYYYHNSNIVNKMNRYGNGYVLPLNQAFEKMNIDLLLLTEEPHFYQVIYPQKLKKDEYITGSDDNIETLPVSLKDRTIITGKHFMETDSLKFSIRLYDHLIKDGDKVSINFNGDWILEDVSLESKPQILKLKLNKTGKNYIILHSEDIGYRPPNTMAISYFYKGEKQNIILRSDLNESELIEITYLPQE